MYTIKVIKYLIRFLDQCKIHKKLGQILPLASLELLHYNIKVFLSNN